MNSKRPGAVKTAVRAAQGGIIAVIALIAMMFLRSSGTGSGDAETESSTAESSQTLVSADTPTPSATSSEAKDTADDAAKDGAEVATGGLTTDEQRALADDVLGVLIDEYDYLLEVPAGNTVLYRPTALNRIVELAAQAGGDSNGLKVRILRRESSRTQAEEDLKSALADTGIGADAVYMPAEFVP
ncbi:MAG: hypothetical protein RIK87_18515 [Fuerstiella sp.]